MARKSRRVNRKKIVPNYNVKFVRKLKNLFYLNSRTIIEYGLASLRVKHKGLQILRY
jgi:hypothetical protein